MGTASVDAAFRVVCGSASSTRSTGHVGPAVRHHSTALLMIPKEHHASFPLPLTGPAQRRELLLFVRFEPQDSNTVSLSVQTRASLGNRGLDLHSDLAVAELQRYGAHCGIGRQPWLILRYLHLPSPVFFQF